MSAEVLKISLYQNNVPVELRKIIFRYYRHEIDDNNIYNAVELWFAENAVGKTIYGHRSDWDTSKVTNMNYLFHNRKWFNDDISSLISPTNSSTNSIISRVGTDPMFSAQFTDPSLLSLIVVSTTLTLIPSTSLLCLFVNSNASLDGLCCDLTFATCRATIAVVSLVPYSLSFAVHLILCVMFTRTLAY